MSTDSAEFWNDVWETSGHTTDGHDAILENTVMELIPGRALELGCGTGANAVWLAEQGWQVTGVDFSEVAIQKARERAEARGVSVEFIVADASTYRSRGRCDLIASFYIQLPPDQRARMLSNAAESLVPGGALVFVSHDRSAPPSGWDEDDLRSLTAPEEIVAELPGLRIEQAAALEASGAHSDYAPGADDGHGHHSSEEHHSHGGSTVVVGVKAE